jgi:hypothetical protein
MGESSVDRRVPASAVGEREMLRDWLEFHRATFARKIEGLSPAQLAVRASPPSDVSLLGLLRHHAEGERWMLGVLFAGDDDVAFFDDEQDFGDFTDVDEAVVAESMAAWQRSCDRSREIEAAASLDDLSAIPGPWANEPVSLRWLLMHTIEEYARHNGHADLLRERIDGLTGW